MQNCPCTGGTVVRAAHRLQRRCRFQIFADRPFRNVGDNIGLRPGRLDTAWLIAGTGSAIASGGRHGPADLEHAELEHQRRVLDLYPFCAHRFVGTALSHDRLRGNGSARRGDPRCLLPTRYGHDVCSWAAALHLRIFCRLPRLLGSPSHWYDAFGHRASGRSPD